MTADQRKISSWPCTWLAVMLILQLLPELSYGQTRAGSAFLKIPPGTRQQNMAGSMTAGLDAPYSLFANPAATGFLREWHLATSLNYWIADIYSLSALAAKRIHGNLNVALGLNVQGVDQFDATGGLAPPASAQDILLSASLGLPFEFPGGRISLGSNVKYLYSDLAQFSASGLIFDAGALYRTRRLPFLFGQKMIVSAGAAVNQLGRDLKFVQRPTPLPKMVRLGLGLNFGTHDGLQTQLTMDYQNTRDEGGRFAFGAEIINPFNSHWGRALTIRGGYAFTGNQDTRLVSKVTFGLSLSFDDYMNSEQRARNAVFLPRNSALRADAGLLSSSSFDNPVQGSLSLKPIGPEKFDFHENTDVPGAMRFDEKRPRFSFRPGFPVLLSWERTQDPDLFDNVKYVVIGTRDDRTALQTLIGKISSYELDLWDLDAAHGFVFSTSSGDTIPFSRLEKSGDLRPGGSQQRRFYLIPDIADRKEQGVALGASMPGEYYWTVAAFDVHNGHVRFAGKSGQNIVRFRVAGALAKSMPPPPKPTPGIRIPDWLNTDLTIDIETPPPPASILFKSDRVKVATLDLCSQLILEDWVEYLKKLPGEQMVRIAGHADIRRGGHVSNRELAEQRAENVRQFLIKEGIDASRLMAVGYADTVFIPRGQLTRERWLALNRRVELETTPRVRIGNKGFLAADAIRVKVSGHVSKTGLTRAACASQTHEGLTLLDTVVDLPPGANLSLPIKEMPIRVESLCAFVDADSILIETDETNNVSTKAVTPDNRELIYPDEEQAELRMIVSRRETVDGGTAEIVVAKLWYEHEGCCETWAFDPYPIVQFEKGVHSAELIRDGGGSSNGLAPAGAPRRVARKIVISKFEPGDSGYQSIATTGLDVSPIESVVLRVFHLLEPLTEPVHSVETGGHGSYIIQQQGTEVQREVTVSGDTVIFRRLPGDETPVEIRLKIPVAHVRSTYHESLQAYLRRLTRMVQKSGLKPEINQVFQDSLKVFEVEVNLAVSPGSERFKRLQTRMTDVEARLIKAMLQEGLVVDWSDNTLVVWLDRLETIIRQASLPETSKATLMITVTNLTQEVRSLRHVPPTQIINELYNRVADLEIDINLALNASTARQEKNTTRATLLAWIERLQGMILQSSLLETEKEKFRERSAILEREVQIQSGANPDILIDIRQKIANLEIDLNRALQIRGDNVENLTLLARLTMLGDRIDQIAGGDPVREILRDSLRVLEREVVKVPQPSSDRMDSLGNRIANVASMITKATTPPDTSDPIPTWAWLLVVAAVVSALSLVPVRAVQDYGRQDVRLRSASIFKTAPEEATLPAESEGAGGPDDLQRIEGIGPEIFDLLTAQGITTFAALAQMTPEALQDILDAGDLKGKNPESWPEQAKLAAQRRWRKLDEWQEKYKHGVKGKKNA